MKQQDKGSFEFSELIDPDALYSLYENDYVLIQQIFYTTLANLQKDLQMIRSGYQSGNVETLRRSIHKIRPVFGFVGMPRLEETCNALEKKCMPDAVAKDLTEDVEALLTAIEQAKQAVETDYRKLIVFNKS